MSRSDRRAGDLVLLRDAVAAIGRELGMPPPDEMALLSSAWPTIVGEHLAPHAWVRSVREGVCTVEVDAPGFATQLRYGEQQFVERAEACCGPGVVTSIRVVLRTPE